MSTFPTHYENPWNPAEWPSVNRLSEQMLWQGRYITLRVLYSTRRG